MKVLKGFALIVLLVVVANVGRILISKASKGMTSSDGKSDFIDGMIGKTAVDRYLEIKGKEDSFNFPALKTGIMMFYTQHSRYPRNMAEFERSESVNQDVTRDRYGKPYVLRFMKKNLLLLNSSGKDRIQGTTDDVEYRLNL